MLHGNDKGDSGSSQLGVGIHGVAGSAVRFASAQLDPTGVPPQLLASGTVCGHALSLWRLICACRKIRNRRSGRPGNSSPPHPGVPSFRRGHMHQHTRAHMPHSSPARRWPHRMHGPHGWLGPAHAGSPSHCHPWIPASTSRRRAREELGVALGKCRPARHRRPGKEDTPVRRPKSEL